MAFPRYTTFPPGEKPVRDRGPLLKAPSCPAAFPDGSRGECRYTRYGPRWHRFDYARPDGPLPHRYCSEPLANDAASIEAKAAELAVLSFREAIETERKDRFARATPQYGTKPDPSLYVASPAEAKKLGGRYALCLALPSGRLIRSSAVFATLEEANAAYGEVGDRRLLVCCFHRLNRRWERPKYGAKGGG